jgi:Tfp pilus assembly protein PilX
MQTRQQGFVLILALVLLAVMTLIGVSSMNSANMELKATANERQHKIAFNAVHSVLEYTLSANAVIKAGTAIDYQTTDPATQLVDHPDANNNAQASVVYVGCSAGIGTSLEEGKGVSYNFYHNSASGGNPTKTSTSIQGRGVKNAAAAC